MRLPRTRRAKGPDPRVVGQRGLGVQDTRVTVEKRKGRTTKGDDGREGLGKTYEGGTGTRETQLRRLGEHREVQGTVGRGQGTPAGGRGPGDGRGRETKERKGEEKRYGGTGSEGEGEGERGVPRGPLRPDR